MRRMRPSGAVTAAHQLTRRERCPRAVPARLLATPEQIVHLVIRTDPHSAAVQIGEPLHDRQSDPCPAGSAVPSGAVERTPDAGGVGLGDARSFVFNRDGREAAVASTRHDNRLLWRSVLQCVVEEIQYNLAECTRIDGRDDPVVNLSDDRRALRPRQRLERLDDVLQEHIQSFRVLS